MTLRRALIALPDDRDTKVATREVVAYLNCHRHVPVAANRIERATGLSSARITSVLKALRAASVVDCPGSADEDEFTFAPDGLLDLEVRRFLKSATTTGAGLQVKVDRFRGRYGSNT